MNEWGNYTIVPMIVLGVGCSTLGLSHITGWNMALAFAFGWLPGAVAGLLVGFVLCGVLTLAEALVREVGRRLDVSNTPR